MDYVETLRIFRAVVEAKSFTRAADMMGVATPMVSRAIASLEKRLHSRLFHRSTRQISLTDSAERFYERCTRTSDAREFLTRLTPLEAEAQYHTHVPTGVLRVVAHTTALMNRMVNLIASFKERHPNVELDITLLERAVDLVADGYDLGIVVPYMLRTDTVLTRLMERIPQVIVASKGYVAANGLPETPTELENHRFVAASPGIRKPLLVLECAGEVQEILMKLDLSSNSPAFNLELIRRGLGLGIIPAPLVRDDINAGRLVQLLPGCGLPGSDKVSMTSVSSKGWPP